MVVAGSGHKTPLFSVEERIDCLREVVAPYKTRSGHAVEVDAWSGLIMNYAEAHRVSAVVRGLRAASDFEYEFMMASMNKKINPNVETLFMMTSQDLFFVSSSMMKELFRYGGELTTYVPAPVLKRLQTKKMDRQ